MQPSLSYMPFQLVPKSTFDDLKPIIQHVTVRMMCLLELTVEI